MEDTPSNSIQVRFQALKQKYERYIPAAFFVAGFLFDIVTISRVDDWFGIVQQTIYLLLVLQILKLKTLEAAGVWQPNEKQARYWRYNDEALHFILGSLLSLYTLFYFVSSSLATSFLFLILIFALLVANELPAFQKRGLILKYGLFSICLYSFLFILVAITLGFVGHVPFFLAMAIGVAAIFGLYKNLFKLLPATFDLKNTLLKPAGAVAGALIFLFIVKLLPPIPLSIQYIGIYHEIEKVRPAGGDETKFLLKYDRPFWKFWQNGAQTFIAEPGDRVHCFVRIFAPANFRDQIVYHWLKKDASGYWQTSDRITNDIAGGRDQGFRGYAIKSNFEPGDWRIQVETTDGREIGRLDFSIELEPTKNLVREFRVDTL